MSLCCKPKKKGGPPARRQPAGEEEAPGEPIELQYDPSAEDFTGRLAGRGGDTMETSFGANGEVA